MRYCTVELYRERKLSYSAIAFTAEVDGEVVGRLHSGETIQFSVPAGAHELCVYSPFGCIGRQIFTVPDNQEYDCLSILTSPFTRYVTFAHGITIDNAEGCGSSRTLGNVLLWVILLIIVIPLLLYLTGILRPAIVFFPLS